MAGILIVDQIQNSSNTLLINSGALAANTVGASQLQPNTAIANITANTLSNTMFQTGAVENYMASTGVPFSYRNIIHNGEMLIDQRWSGANVSATYSTTPNNYGLDRWQVNNYNGTTANTIYFQQVADAPTGFYNSLKITCTLGVATSSNSTGRRNIAQYIEGLFAAHLNWGTSAGRPVTISFWVKSSLTGAHAFSIQAPNQSYSYATTYTINSANTWQYVVINVPAPPVSGNWVNNNQANQILFWDLGQGSAITASSAGQLNSWQAADLRGYANAVHIGDTTGATWQITGVQMEPGNVATPFEHRPYALEFSIAQRYFYLYNNTGLSDQTYAYSPYSPPTYTSLPNSSASCNYYFPVTMRVAPTVGSITGGSYASVNRSTTSVYQCTMQWASTTSGNAIYVGGFWASAEL